MTEIQILTVSQKGQIVLPKKIRDELKINKGEKLIMIEEKGEITLKKASFKKNKKSPSFPLAASETSLAKDWLSKEEDKAWKNL